MSESNWQTICNSEDLIPMLGVRALINDKQIAIFRVKDKLYGLSAIDPFTKAAVLSRGLVGDIKGQIVVASPLYKQHFVLESGQCLEDDMVTVETFPVREVEDKVQVLA